MKQEIEYMLKKELLIGVLVKKFYFQKDLLKTTIKVRNSSLPANIPADNNHFPISEIS